MLGRLGASQPRWCIRALLDALWVRLRASVKCSRRQRLCFARLTQRFFDRDVGALTGFCGVGLLASPPISRHQLSGACLTHCWSLARALTFVRLLVSCLLCRHIGTVGALPRR